MTPGEVVLEERKKRHWDQAELADKMGVSRSLIGFIENGERAVTLATARGFAKVFGRPIKDFLPPDAAVDDRTLRVLEYLDQIPEEEQDDFLDLVGRMMALRRPRQ